MQLLQLALGIVESIAQRGMNILVSGAIESQTISVDPHIGDSHIDLN